MTRHTPLSCGGHQTGSVAASITTRCHWVCPLGTCRDPARRPPLQSPRAGSPLQGASPRLWTLPHFARRAPSPRAQAPAGSLPLRAARARLPDSAATGDPAAFGSLCLRHLAHHPLVGSSRISSFLSAADGAALHTLPAFSSSVHPPAAAAAVARGRRRRERGGRGPLPEAVVSFPSDPYPGAGVLGRTGVLPVVLRGNAPPSPSLAPLRRRLFRTVFPVLSRRSEGQDPDPLCPNSPSSPQCFPVSPNCLPGERDVQEREVCRGDGTEAGRTCALARWAARPVSGSGARSHFPAQRPG